MRERIGRQGENFLAWRAPQHNGEGVDGNDATIDKFGVTPHGAIADATLGLSEATEVGSGLSRQQLANYLAANGNYEPKAILLLLMKNGQRYSGAQLSRMMQHARGVPGTDVTPTQQEANYCDLSLIPIGLVVKQEYVDDVDGRIKQVYIKTDPDNIGTAVSEQMLAFSDRNRDISLLGILGQTASSAEERLSEGPDAISYKTRSPLLRLQILEQLISQAPPTTLTQLAQVLDESHARIRRHLNELSSRGNIITYKTFAADESLAQYIIPEGVQPMLEGSFIEKRNVALTTSVLTMMLANQGLVTVKRVRDVLIAGDQSLQVQNQARLATRISDILHFLEKRGYVKGDREAKFTLKDDRPESPPPPLVARRYISLGQDLDAVIRGMEGTITIQAVQARLLEDPSRQVLHPAELTEQIARLLNYFESEGYVESQGRWYFKYGLREDRPDTMPASLHEVALTRDIYGAIKASKGTFTTSSIREMLLAADASREQLRQGPFETRIGSVLLNLQRAGYLQTDGVRYADYRLRDDIPDTPPPSYTFSRDEALMHDIYTAVERMAGEITIDGIRQILLVADSNKGALNQAILARRISLVLGHLEATGYMQRDKELKFALREDRPDDTPPTMTASPEASLGQHVLGLLGDIQGPITVSVVKAKLFFAQPGYRALDQETLDGRVSGVLNVLERNGHLARAKFEKGTYSKISLTDVQRLACEDLVQVIHGLESGDVAVLTPGKAQAAAILGDPERVAALYRKAKENSPLTDAVGTEGTKGQILTIIATTGGSRSTEIQGLLKELYGNDLGWNRVSALLLELRREERLTAKKSGKGNIYRPSMEEEIVLEEGKEPQMGEIANESIAYQEDRRDDPPGPQNGKGKSK